MTKAARFEYDLWAAKNALDPHATKREKGIGLTAEMV